MTKKPINNMANGLFEQASRKMKNCKPCGIQTLHYPTTDYRLMCSRCRSETRPTWQVWRRWVGR